MTQDIRNHSIKVSVVVSIIVSTAIAVSSAVWFVSRITSKLERVESDVADLKKTQLDFIVEVRSWRKQYEERIGKIEVNEPLIVTSIENHTGKQIRNLR